MILQPLWGLKLQENTIGFPVQKRSFEFRITLLDVVACLSVLVLPAEQFVLSGFYKLWTSRLQKSEIFCLLLPGIKEIS